MEFKYAKKLRRGVEYIFIDCHSQTAKEHTNFFTKRFASEHIIYTNKTSDGAVQLNPLQESDKDVFFDYGSFRLDWMLECPYEVELEVLA